jgi:hypothetical protein
MSHVRTTVDYKKKPASPQFLRYGVESFDTTLLSIKVNEAINARLRNSERNHELGSGCVLPLLTCAMPLTCMFRLGGSIRVESMNKYSCFVPFWALRIRVCTIARPSALFPRWFLHPLSACIAGGYRSFLTACVLGN